jgi:hypothetical protein
MYSRHKIIPRLSYVTERGEKRMKNGTGKEGITRKDWVLPPASPCLSRLANPLLYLQQLTELGNTLLHPCRTTHLAL